MSRTVSATEARVHLGELLDTIEDNEAISIEYAGSADTVVVPAHEAQMLGSAADQDPTWSKSLERARASFARDLGEQPRPDFVQVIRDGREVRGVERLVVQPEPGDWKAAFARVRERMREEVGNVDIDTDEIIRTMREERVAELLDGLH